MNVKYWPVLLVMALIPRALGQGLPELGDVAGAAFPAQLEKRIGEEAYRDIRYREPSFLDDAEVSHYINELGRKLVAASSDRNTEFEFFAIQDRTINAFAMPGGFVGMHTGLLLAAQSESEVAAVLAHEVSHVTQRHIARGIGKQNDISVVSIAATVIALIAARNGGELAPLALASANAAAIQAQLNYSRDFEREADRVGFQVLTDAGFDGHAMAVFFERMQKAGRFVDGSAPAYLRTHPMSGERMSDIQNRAQFLPYKQVGDSIDFHLIRGKLRALQGDSRDAVQAATEQIRQKRYASEAGARFFLVSALIRDKNYSLAEGELKILRSLKLTHPMVDLLESRLLIAQNKTAQALSILRNALSKIPGYWPLRQALAQLLQDGGQHVAALQESEELLKGTRKDANVFALRAKSFAATGQLLRMHQALAEQYYLMGSLPGAIEQLQFAQKRGGGDFFLLSVIEARLREFQAELAQRTKKR
ncbi:MAG: M48 family metalloprotease [Burkholderiales bacterium]